MRAISTHKCKGSVLYKVPLFIVAIALVSGCSMPSISGEKTYEREVMVCSNFIWQHTFIYCKEGDLLLIKADRGAWQTRFGLSGASGVPNTLSDKSFLFPGVTKAAMIGRLGEKIFFVGSKCSHKVSKDEEGELRLSCNLCPGQNDQENDFNVSDGSIKAIVTVLRSSSDSDSPLKP